MIAKLHGLPTPNSPQEIFNEMIKNLPIHSQSIMINVKLHQYSVIFFPFKLSLLISLFSIFSWSHIAFFRAIHQNILLSTKMFWSVMKITCQELTDRGKEMSCHITNLLWGESGENEYNFRYNFAKWVGLVEV